MEDEGVALACKSGARVVVNRGVGEEKTGRSEENKKKKTGNGEDRRHFGGVEEAMLFLELRQ